jgi:hypothetical protein
LFASSALLGVRVPRHVPRPDYKSGKHIECFQTPPLLLLVLLLQVGMLTHQPPELLQDGRMSPAVDIYRYADGAGLLYSAMSPATITLLSAPAVPGNPFAQSR